MLKASAKVESIPDDPLWIEHPHALFDALTLDDELKKYKLVDTDGQAFADAALSEREDNRQLGANNFWLAPHFIKRLGHLGWGFGPSITALGLACAFDHDNSPVSVHRTYSLAAEAFPRVKKILFQELNMPDETWNPKGLPIPLRRAVDIFIPNVNSIDMDTTGTWPFGRRLTDQVATRFLSTFLDMSASLDGKRYHVELLNDPALWKAAPIEPKTPPNPLKNDKEFCRTFPIWRSLGSALMAGYEAEIGRLDEDIAAFGGAAALCPPTDAARVTQYVYRLYQKASLAGDLTALRRVEATIDRAIPLLAQSGDLYLLKANVAFKLHRLADVAAALSASRSVFESEEGRLIRADLDFQYGRYREAEDGYQQVLAAERSWAALARMAYFRGRWACPPPPTSFMPRRRTS